jgi:galactose mutarotase-like enzyme
MLHTIENKNLICFIRSVGAEVRSLKNKETQEEYIWQIDNTVWGSSAPVLFPAIGNLKFNKVTYKGKEYAMPKHGIIRNNKDLCFEQLAGSKCAFTLTSSETTKKQYPFDFSFNVIYELIDKSLVVTYIIENKDTVSMPFACGGHTAYGCSLDSNTKLSDYVIEFPSSVVLESKTIGASGLLTNNIRPVETNNGILSLSDTLFNEDALVFANINFEWVRLRKQKELKGVKVIFKDYPHLAIWSKPKADYVCIEPWLGLPDMEDESIDLSEKTTYKTIEPNSKFSITIITEIE